MNAPTVIAPDRSRFIGGSDVAAILGISPWKSAMDLWIDKTTPALDDGRNAGAKRRGTRLEPYILDMIREDYGLVIVRNNERYVDPALPFLAAEIDAETDNDTNIEIKSVHPFKVKEWGEIESDDLPLHYVAQAQHGLGVTGRLVCKVFALIGDDLKPYTIERDDELILAMRDRCIEFWRKYVEPRVMPPYNYEHKGVIETLKRLYPGTDGTVIEGTDAHRQWREVFLSAKEKRDQYDAVVEGAKAHLLAEMGHAAAIRFDDGKAFTRKIVNKKPYVVEYPPTSYVDFRFAKFKE